MPKMVKVFFIFLVLGLVASKHHKRKNIRRIWKDGIVNNVGQAVARSSSLNDSKEKWRSLVDAYKRCLYGNQEGSIGRFKCSFHNQLSRLYGRRHTPSRDAEYPKPKIPPIDIRKPQERYKTPHNLMEMERKRVHHDSMSSDLPKSDDIEIADNNAHFALSIVPYLKTLSPKKNLLAKSKILIFLASLEDEEPED